MKEILIKLLALTLLSYTGEMLLPEGNMKKYSNLLLSVVLCASLISSLGGSRDIDTFLIGENNASDASGKFYENVMAEYKKRAETEIEKRCGAKAQIETDENYNITHVKFLSLPENTDFLINDLEVSENEIEFTDK